MACSSFNVKGMAEAPAHTAAPTGSQDGDSRAASQPSDAARGPDVDRAPEARRLPEASQSPGSSQTSGSSQASGPGQTSGPIRPPKTSHCRCIVCDSARSPGAVGGALSDSVGPGCSVDACMSAILHQPLRPLVDVDAFVCDVCLLLLKEVVSLEMRGRELRRSVRSNFAQTFCDAVSRGERREDGKDAAAELLMSVELVDEEEVGGFGAVTIERCQRCDQMEAEAATSVTKTSGDARKRTKEDAPQIQVIHVKRPAKRSQHVQTEDVPPAVPESRDSGQPASCDVTGGAPVSDISSAPASSDITSRALTISEITSGASEAFGDSSDPPVKVKPPAAEDAIQHTAPPSDSGDDPDDSNDFGDPGDPDDPDDTEDTGDSNVAGDSVDPGDSKELASADSMKGRALRSAAPGRMLRRRRPPPSDDKSADGEDTMDTTDAADTADGTAEDLRCELCGVESADAAALARHRASCVPAVLWRCALCGRSFGQLPQLKRHTRQHQLVTKQLGVCLKCGLVCPDQPALDEHSFSRHEADAPDIRICGFCGLGFWAESELAAHAETHTTTCTVCHKQLRKDSMREHMRRHTGETPFGCDECGKRFVAFSSLRAHRRTHTGDKPHKCHLCAEMFHLKESLTEHLERHENRTLRCGQCSREFPSSRRLAAHVKTHDKRRHQPHTCEFCGDGFMRRRSLRAHRAKHTGPLPFTCDVCGKGFTYEDAYKEHLSVHSGQRPYTCEVCGKSYGRRSCLWAHRNQHTNPARFSCAHCGKHFTSQSAFNVHMRIHTGERPYRCTSCTASFRLLSSLKRHSESCSGPGVGGPPPPAVDVTPALPTGGGSIRVQLCTPGGGTAQIHMPAVPPPPLYSAPWQPPLPPPAPVPAPPPVAVVVEQGQAPMPVQQNM